MIRATTPRDETRPVLLPGEPEDLIAGDRAEHGIPLPDDTVSELRELSEQYNVEFVDGVA